MQAAPGPLLGARTEARAHGIRKDVVDRRGQVLVAVDDPRGVAIAEQMAAALVPSVEGERVGSVQPLHTACHRLDARLEDEVVVRRHQAVRVEAPPETADAVGEEREEPAAVEPVAEDRRVVDAEGRHVEDAVRQLRAEDAGHARNVCRRRVGHDPRGPKVTLSSRRTGPLPPTLWVRPKGPVEMDSAVRAAGTRRFSAPSRV
jgi:hypothetical protein